MRLLRPLLIVLFLLLFSSGAYAQVVVNEVLIDSILKREKDKLGEWIELYNNGTTAVDISNWNIGNGKVNFTIPAGRVLNHTEFLLLVYNQTITNISNVTIIEYGGMAKNLILTNKNGSVFLYNSLGELTDSYGWNDSEENISQGRYPDGLEWKEKLFPTPGAPNQLLPPLQPNVKLTIYLQDEIALGILQTSLFRIDVKNKENCSLKDTVTVKYNISSNGSLIKEDIFSKEVSCHSYADTGEWLPNKTGNFLLCGEVIDSTVNETDFSDNFACKNILIVEVVSILTQPISAKFGDFKFIFVKLNTAVYGHEGVRLLVYGKSKRVIADLSWNKITKYADCSGDLAVETNLTVNQTYFFSIPFFIYPNCDAYYSDGSYEIALRVCRPSETGWEKYLEHVFTLPISGKNEKLCPEPEIRTVFKTLPKEESITKSNATKEESYRIIFSPEEVRPGEEFNVIVFLKNLATSAKNFTVFSYVFEGNRLLSEGLDEKGEWRKTWAANKRQIFLQAGEEKQLTLTNRIKVGVEPGMYNLRVRIKGEKDLTLPIEILKPIEARMNCTATGNNITIAVINVGDEANFSLIALHLNETVKFSLKEGESKEQSFSLLPTNKFVLTYGNKVLDSCSYVKRVEKEIVEKGREEGFEKRITGMFAKGFDFLSSLVEKLLKFLGFK